MMQAMDSFEQLLAESPTRALADAQRRLSRKRTAVSLADCGAAFRRLGNLLQADAHLSAGLLAADRPEDLSMILGRLSYLRRDQGRILDALRLNLTMVEISAGVDAMLEAKALFQAAHLRVEPGPHRDLSAALDYLGRAETALGDTPGSDLRLSLIETSVFCSLESGGLARAAQGLDLLRELVPAPSPARAANLEWLEGLYWRYRRHPFKWEAKLASASDQFADLQMPLYAATARMDLAVGLLVSGRPSEAKAETGRLWPLLKSLSTEKEMWAALAVVISARAETLSARTLAKARNAALALASRSVR